MCSARQYPKAARGKLTRFNVQAMRKWACKRSPHFLVGFLVSNPLSGTPKSGVALGLYFVKFPPMQMSLGDATEGTGASQTHPEAIEVLHECHFYRVQIGRFPPKKKDEFLVEFFWGTLFSLGVQSFSPLRRPCNLSREWKSKETAKNREAKKANLKVETSSDMFRGSVP